ncbi:MAG: hypothetical protein CME88_15655 [Hirschia sp.]|nr:hypothetical protein [Hirschia sp.]MBF19815.1 hypothetical protein [Hirschia sp.]
MNATRRRLQTETPTSSNSSRSSRLPVLDMLRIFAAICVAVSHLVDIESKYDPNPIFPDKLNWGVFGVDMFFVISGYLMVVIAKRRGDALRPLPYLADRAARIYPLYWLVSAALLAVWIVRPDVVFSSNTDPDILKSFLLWPAPADPLHALGYSLIHFMFFYIVFTLLLAVFRSKRIVIGLAVWCIVLAGVNAALFSIDSLPTRQTPELRILLHPYAFSFIVGGLVAGLPRRKMVGLAALIIGMAATLFSLFGPQYLFDYNMKMDEWGRVVFRALPFAVAVYGAGCFSTSPINIPFQRKLADIAFATILIHVLTFSLVGRFWAPFAVPAWWDNILAFTVMGIFTIIVSWIAYEFLEKPICNFLRGLYRQKPTSDRVI